MKKLVHFIVMVLIQILTANNIQAQVIISKSTENKLISYGIDPENLTQVIDSLDTEDDFKRLWLIDWVGERKIYEAVPKLKLLFQLTNTTNFPKYRRLEQKSQILRTVMDLEDTTFQEEFREELDSLSLNDNNYYYIMLFSAYLQEMHNDSYGWQYMEKFFTPEFADTTTVRFFSINIYSLKPFLDSEYHGEAAEILRYFAEHNYIALDYLAEVNDPETEQLAINMSLNHPESFSRHIANQILQNINLESFIATLKASLNTVTDNRTDIYEGLLRTGQPAVYKYVVDLYNSNHYPSDSSIILQDLESNWIFFPDTAASVTNLLDSLSSALFQFNSFGWIGNLTFVNELNALVQSSKTYYASNDTVSSAGQLKLLREIIDQELRDSVDLINEYVQLYAWKYLYPRAFFIERRISSGDWTDSLLSVSPSSVRVGSPTTTARIIGSGFSYGTYLYWNKNEYLDFDIISPSEIDVIIPENFLIEGGKYILDASNLLTYVSNSLIFNVLDLTSLNPSSKMVNSPPFILTINGHGFDSLSTVYFNSNAKTTIYISDSVLTSEISTSDISVVGSYPVWVTDQWAASDTLFFTVTPPPPVLNSISPGLTLMPEIEANILYNPEFDFTLTLTGDLFTDSSVIYFNNEILPTTFVSDSIVTCQIIADYITATGYYQVWVSNYGSISDTLFITAVDSLPEYVTPVVNCVHDNGDRNYTTYLGYINYNSSSVHIPYGKKNMFWPCSLVYPINRDQPNIFLSGIQNNVFTIDFNTTSSPPCADFYKWILDRESVDAADPKANPCEE